MQASHDDFPRLAHDYWEWLMRNDPTYATYLGDGRYNDRLPEVDGEARERQVRELEALLGRLRALAEQPAGGDEERVSRAILDVVLEEAIRERSLPFHEFALDQLVGPQVWLFEVPNYHPLATDKDYADLAARYRAFPDHIRAYVENLREGVAHGRTAPPVAVERVVGQLRDTLSKAPLDLALRPDPAKRPADVPQKRQLEVEEAIVSAVLPAYRSLLAFLEDGYPARPEVGIWSLPGGEEMYRFKVRTHTSTVMSPDEIHRMGLDMVAQVREQMLEVARKRGYAGDLRSFTEKLRSDPALCATSREQLLDGYRQIMRRVEDVLPRYFGRLPRARCEVKAIEEYREKDSVAGYYYTPPDDFSRPGLFYANTYRPETRPLFNMEALTVHEAMPGHHLQMALAMELSNLPDFRRHGKFTAFIEGWALYCERLSEEMGIYRDDLSRFGMLTHQAWRVTRLVVDTGLHHLRWDRDRAREYFLDNVGLPEGETLNEIDRYIVWPGQALSYAVGMREMRRLRALAESEMGSAFDLRAYHDEILRHGDLPLSLLEQVVREHIARQGAAVNG